MYVGTVFFIDSRFRTVEVCDVFLVYCVERFCDVYIPHVAEFARNVFAGFVHCFGQIHLRTFNKQIPAVITPRSRVMISPSILTSN